MEKNIKRRNVWALIETAGQKLHSMTPELMGEGKRLAAELGEDFYAVLPGYELEHLTPDLYAYGADRVICLEHPKLQDCQTVYLEEAMAEILERKKPAILLAGATISGRELTSRLAARLRAGLLKDCTDLSVDRPEFPDRQLTACCAGIEGTGLCRYKTKNQGVQIAALRQGAGMPAFPTADSGDRRPERICPALSETTSGLTLLSRKQAPQVRGLEDAKIIAAGGRGIGEEGMEMLSELAERLGGMAGCTRPCVDAGWADFKQQIGQTGITVKPDLYLAFGISGAVQHTAGMKESACVIGINTDPQAEIFRYCDYGIMADAKGLLTALLKNL